MGALVAITAFGGLLALFNWLARPKDRDRDPDAVPDQDKLEDGTIPDVKNEESAPPPESQPADPAVVKAVKDAAKAAKAEAKKSSKAPAPKVVSEKPGKEPKETDPDRIALEGMREYLRTPGKTATPTMIDLAKTILARHTKEWQDGYLDIQGMIFRAEQKAEKDQEILNQDHPGKAGVKNAESPIPGTASESPETSEWESESGPRP